MTSSQNSHPSPLFAYPPQAAFGKVIPKTKIYKHAKAGKRVQQAFVDQVARIEWQYKLAPETIRLPARDGIEEIQVFRLELKEGVGDKLAIEVLRCLDKAVPFPNIIEVCDRERVRVVAAYKRPSEAESGKWVLGDHYHSAWYPMTEERSPLPVVVDLAALYGELLRRLLPYPPREAESLRTHAERIERINALERELARLQGRLGRERQFNRKVDVNREVGMLREELEGLK